VLQHSQWVPNPYLGYPNDIALLRLKEPADLSNPNIELACIANEYSFNFTNEECWITGWGLMDCGYYIVLFIVFQINTVAKIDLSI